MKQECEPCHRTCRSCGGPDDNDGDSCEDDMLLDRGQCISISKIKCPDGKFLNGQGECEQCDSSYRTCSGHRKDRCDSCHEASCVCPFVQMRLIETRQVGAVKTLFDVSGRTSLSEVQKCL
ncbi:proprotein convertase subtilisin/kexin type 5-like [Sinocyclocheilus grahami]|uniref:proprotein convertase subtilisin/kexin type 5-like n=1 Tax=Sinocyclocheilus grahami TaxID=75366 RepID=UPI0007ACB58B|nr:PREDICTED: proprotein convertase subtilisin/kexin type 5-like [Sinocyclocheilus grahami]